jgi:hypothetical protein
MHIEPNEKTLYYAQINQTLVFAPASAAVLQAQKWYAIHHSKTWEDFINFTSPEVFDELILEILEALGYERLYPQYLHGEDLSSYITDLHLPQATDVFSTDILPDFDEGGYMPVLSQEIMAWLPEEIMDNIGKIEYDEAHEFYYYINPETENAVIMTLEAAGYHCQKNEAIMLQATGTRTEKDCTKDDLGK